MTSLPTEEAADVLLGKERQTASTASLNGAFLMDSFPRSLDSKGREKDCSSRGTGRVEQTDSRLPGQSPSIDVNLFGDSSQDTAMLLQEDDLQRDESPGLGLRQKASVSMDRRKLVFGVPIVIGIAVSWVGSTQTAKSTYSAHFNAPFCTVWFTTLWMMTCFPVYLVGRLLLTRDTLHQIWSDCRHILALYNTGRLSSSSKLVVDVFLVVGPFTILWLCTNYMYLRALGKIDPADVTALFSSAPAFVFIFSCLLLGEQFLLLPLAAVCMAITGIVLFAYAEGFKAATAEGVILSVGAAVGAGLYKTLFKRVVGDAGLGQVSLFLSFLGLLNLLFAWPVCITLATTHTEKLVSIPWTFLVSTAFLGLLFNFFINFGIAVTYPLFISLGTVLGIPLNALADQVFRHITFSAWKIVSTEFILVAFVMLLLPRKASLCVQEIIMSCIYCRPTHPSDSHESLLIAD